MITSKNRILTLGMAGALLCLASNLPAQNVLGKWYLGLDAGLALQPDITLKYAGGEDRLVFDPGVRLGLSGGVHLHPSWRAELELGFIYNSVDARTQDYFQMPILANLIYSVPLRGPFSAYAGAGVGGVYTVFWTDLWSTEEGLAFGYQGIAGVKYALNDGLDVGLSYKLLGTIEHDLGPARSEGTLTHSILAAFTFKF